MTPEQQQSWWEQEDEAARSKAVCAAAADLRNRQTQRWAAMELALCLYDDASGTDLTVSDFTFTILDEERRTPLNLVRSAIDTVRAELIQGKPRPQCTPTGADWSVRRKCQQLNKFLGGVFSEEAFDRTASAVVLDALVFGAGIARPVVEDGKVKIERIPPWEVWVDADEARYGSPRTLYLTRYAHKDVLKGRYPKAADAIDQARSHIGHSRGAIGIRQVAVVEAWHLPSTPGAGDGLHVIAVDAHDGVLFSEPWEHDWFPLAFLHWKAPLQGFWGQGLAGELVEAQAELNKATYNVQVGHDYHAHTHILASVNSGLNPEAMTDEPGKIWWYNGAQEPKALVFPAVNPEVYAWIKDTIAWGYQLAGVSMSAARSERVAGLSSGRAIQLNSDLQSRRFMDSQRNFEQFHVDVGRTVVRVVEHSADAGQALEVVHMGSRRGERIKWSKARLDESSFMLRLDPVSSTASSPAGRSDYIASLIQSGQAAQVGAPEQALRALNDLDTESFNQAVTVAWDLVDQICEDILDKGEDGYRPPEPFFNLSVCLLVGLITYQEWCLLGVPDDRCDVLRDWIDQTRVALDKAASASAPPANSAAPSPAPAPDAAAPPAPLKAA